MANKKKKFPLWLELALISSVPTFFILISIFVFLNLQKKNGDFLINTQKSIFSSIQKTESLRLQIRKTDNSFELKNTLKQSSELISYINSNKTSFERISPNQTITLMNYLATLNAELSHYEKYNVIKTNFEIETQKTNNSIADILHVLNYLSAKNQSDANYFIKNTSIKIAVLLLFILIISTLISAYKIKTLINSIGKITESFSHAGEKFQSIEEIDSDSGVVELDLIYNSIIENSNEIYNRKQEILEKSRLATIGETAAHIAHEILTPLTVIKLNSHKLQKSEDTAISSIAKVNQKMVDRISKIIIATKKSAYKNESEEFEVIKIEEFIEELKILVMLKANERNVELTITNEVNISFKGKEGELLQVLINLINNSLDAIEGLEQKWISLKVDLNGNNVVLTLTDSGSGIPEAVLEKMFNSFFTTKKIGKGTGIGLSLSKKIIEDHKGKLEYNKNCPNTQFIISLPI